MKFINEYVRFYNYEENAEIYQISIEKYTARNVYKIRHTFIPVISVTNILLVKILIFLKIWINTNVLCLLVRYALIRYATFPLKTATLHKSTYERITSSSFHDETSRFPPDSNIPWERITLYYGFHLTNELPTASESPAIPLV